VSAGSKQQATRSGPGSGGSVGSALKMDAAQLTTVLRQCLHASSTLKRLGGHFFPAVANIFEARMERNSREMLDNALITFHAELGRYDWVPSTALSGGTVGPGSTEGAAASGPGWLHPQALDLTRHRPLAVFANDFVQAFNELRQCTLYGLRVPVVSHCYECLMAAVNMLRSVVATQTLQPASSKASEFARMCRHFADILVPLIASHLEALFGSGGRLDVGSVVAAMVPDLIQAEVEVEYSHAGGLTELEEPPKHSPEAEQLPADSSATTSGQTRSDETAASPQSGYPPAVTQPPALNESLLEATPLGRC
ncbi:unnamed protein product, partial [Polarella glacialis]